MIGIYSITNKKTGQMYIGQSINIERRFKEHIRGDGCPNSRIDNAIQKYGKDCFKFKIIEEFNEDTPFLNDVLNDSEQYYIAAYNTFQNDFHYNLTPGGDFSPMKVSEIVQRISGENHPMYGQHLSEETKKKLSETNTGKKLSEKTKKKMSEAKFGKNNGMYGKHHSEETKKKISEAKKGKRHSEETKKKMSELHKGKHLSEEIKKKMSEIRKGKYIGKNSSMWKDYARIVKKVNIIINKYMLLNIKEE